MRCAYFCYYKGTKFCVKLDCDCGYDDFGQDPHDPNGPECQDYEEKEALQ